MYSSRSLTVAAAAADRRRARCADGRAGPCVCGSLPRSAETLSATMPLHRLLPGKKHDGKRPATKPRQQIEIIDAVADLDFLEACGADHRGAQMRRLRARAGVPTPWPAAGIVRSILPPPPSGRTACEGGTPRRSDRRESRCTCGQLGKLVKVLLDAAGVLGPLAAIFHVDLDQLDQSQKS